MERWKVKRQDTYAFMAADGEDNDAYGTDDGYDYGSEASYHGAFYVEDEQGDYETGTFAEEHLAYLTEHGMDIDDPESCDYAAEIIQAEEAYMARTKANRKGYGGFTAPPFEVSRAFSLDQKRMKLQNLKARTACRKCGAIGHWSGDIACPLSKGKGKGTPRPGTSSTSATSTSGAGTSSHHGGGAKGGKNTQKPRTVYFSIREDQPENAQAHLAYRTPDPHGRAPQQTSHHAVPPPSSLLAGAVLRGGDPTSTATSPTSGSWSVVPTEWAAVADDRRWLNNDVAEDEDMVMLIEALQTDAEPRPLQDLPRPPAAPLAQVEWNIATAAPAPRPTASGPQPDGPPQEVRPPVPEPGARRCGHQRTTAHGSNGYDRITRCRDCGEVLHRERRDATMEAPTASATPAAGCQHHRV